MSDRRTFEERQAAIAEVRRDLNAWESVPSREDLAPVLDAILTRHGFGEAWAKSAPVHTAGFHSEMLIFLRVENTESPQFILMRERMNGPVEAEFGWGVYTWVPGT